MTTRANIHDAKTNLSRLIEMALAGEEVVIAKAGKPLVKLVPIEVRKPLGDWLGKYPHRIPMPTDAEWAAMDAEIEADFLAPDNDADLPQDRKGVAEE